MAVTYYSIASQVLLSNTATLTFSGIPNTYTDLILKVDAKTDAGTIQDNLNLQFNGDTASNYTTMSISGSPGITGSVQNNTAGTSATIYAGAEGSNTSGANTFGMCEVNMPNYTSTTKKLFRGRAISCGSTTLSVMNQFGITYNNTTAISSITIFRTTGTTFLTGSRFDLYGITHF